MKVTIVGRGKVGTGLFHWCSECRVDVGLVSASEFVSQCSSKLRALAESNHASTEDSEIHVAILAVPDGAIEDVAEKLHRCFDVLFHCAGSLGPEAFGALLSQRSGFGVLHPLISFASKEHPPPRRSPAFAIAGDDKARFVAANLVSTLGGIALTNERGESILGPRYHAAAALLANGAVALAFLARGILDSLEVEESVANAALAALLESVTHNVALQGVPAALTGPIARGNVDTVSAHLQSLSDSKELTRAYAMASELILQAAQKAGLDEKSAGAIETLLLNSRKLEA